MAEINTNNQNFLREEDSSLRLSDLWNMVWRYKWWYVVSIVVFLLLGAFYLYRTPNVYDRSAKVVIDESNQDATMRNLGVASAGMMRLRSFNSVESIAMQFVDCAMNDISLFDELKYLKSVTAESVFKRLSLFDNENTVLSVINPLSEE